MTIDRADKPVLLRMDSWSITFNDSRAVDDDDGQNDLLAAFLASAKLLCIPRQLWNVLKATVETFN